MYISRKTQIIDGVQLVPGQLMGPRGSFNASGKSAECRPLAEGEALMQCEDCKAEFSADFVPDPLPYHKRLCHGAEPGPAWKGKSWQGMPSQPTEADYAEFLARKRA